MRTVRRSISTGLAMLGVLTGVSLVPVAPALAVGGLEAPAVGSESVTATGQLWAIFAGTVNPEEQAVTACEFQYVDEATFNATGFTGTPPSLPCSPSAGELGGSSPVSVRGIGPGLAPGKTYYYRLLATNATGTTAGTPERLPTAAAGGATAVAAQSARIAGSVSPGAGPGSETVYYFQWGTDTSYGNQIPLSATPIANGAGAVPETAQLTGLQSDATYYYRVVAENGSAVAYSEGRSFTTPATPPVITPLAVGGVTQTAASIAATIDAEGLPTNYELLLGNAPGNLFFQAGGSFSGSTPEAVTVNMQSLLPGTVYYCKLVAVNSQGTTESPEASFTTAPSTAVVPVTPPIPIAFPTVTRNEDTTIILPSASKPSKPAKAKKHPKKPKKKKHARKQGKKKPKKSK
jgi:hypothetical protein